MFDNAYNNFYNNNQGSLACDGAKLSSEYFEYRKAGYVTVAGFYCLRTMATTNRKTHYLYIKVVCFSFLFLS